VGTPAFPPREVRPREWAIGLGSAFVGVLVTLLVLVAFGAIGARHRPIVPPAVVTTPDERFDINRLSQVAEAVRPSVVTVQATAAGAPARTLVAGVAVQSNRVVTLLHPLNGTTTLQVVTQDGQPHAAKLAATDPVTDLALLVVADGRLSGVPIDPATPRISAPLVVVAPRNLNQPLVDWGLVTTHNLMADTGTGVQVAGLIGVSVQNGPDWLGAVLVDEDGEVVGLVDSTVVPTPRLVAIPGVVVRDARDQLDAAGKANHGYLGVQLQLDDTTHPAGGAKVVSVVANTAAAKAGITAGALVTRAGGESIGTSADLLAVIRSRRPQDPLDLDFTSPDGKVHRDVATTLGTLLPQSAADNPMGG
jgi:S1-C subfamily serine protease